MMPYLIILCKFPSQLKPAGTEDWPIRSGSSANGCLSFQSEAMVCLRLVKAAGYASTSMVHFRSPQFDRFIAPVCVLACLQRVLGWWSRDCEGAGLSHHRRLKHLKYSHLGILSTRKGCLATILLTITLQTPGMYWRISINWMRRLAGDRHLQFGSHMIFAGILLLFLMLL